MVIQANQHEYMHAARVTYLFHYKPNIHLHGFSHSIVSDRDPSTTTSVQFISCFGGGTAHRFSHPSAIWWLDRGDEQGDRHLLPLHD